MHSCRPPSRPAVSRGGCYEKTPRHPPPENPRKELKERDHRSRGAGRGAGTAPLYGDLRAWLEKAYAVRGTAWTIVSYEGSPIQETKTAWHTGCVAAGLPDLLIHDLRRTAVRNMVRAGIPKAHAKQISGHLTDSVFDRYDIVDEGDVASAGKKLAAFHKAEQKQLDQAKEAAAKVLSGADSEKVRTKVRTVAKVAVTSKSSKGVLIQ